MPQYLFLDQSAARSSRFTSLLNDPNAKIMVGDSYFSELTRASESILINHATRLSDFRSRIFYVKSCTQCLKMELRDRQCTTRKFTIDARFTGWLRKSLAHPQCIVDQIKNPDIRETVKEDHYRLGSIERDRGTEARRAF